MKLATEKEKEEYKEQHPELEEVMQIINEIDSNNVPKKLKQARKIREWIEKSSSTKQPSGKSVDKEEKTLGMAYQSIKQCLIKPYMELTTEKAKQEYKEQHPELEEIMQIINEIDSNNIPKKLKQAREIREWIKNTGSTKVPSSFSTNEEEKRLGSAYQTIKRHLIKPYMKLMTEKEKEEYKEKYPETEEVMKIIAEINLKYGTKKDKELAALIKQDLEKRKTLKEARELEQDYEKQLLAKRKKEGIKEEGVTLDE